MTQYKIFPDLSIGHANIRLRRLRSTPSIRALVQENHLSKNDLIWPVFISETGTTRKSIHSLPGVDRIPLNELVKEIEKAVNLGIQAVMLFPIIDSSKKDLYAKESYHLNGLSQQAIRLLKKEFPTLVTFVDVALDPYTTHGHDGIIDDSSTILNDETINVLVKQSLSYAHCGVDFICPSDMMDGRIGAIRTALDKEGFINTGILSYSAKYASAFYGPFREALASGAKGLDKKTYQMNVANRQEALREALFDIEEGADIVMVKPGLLYLDIVRDIKENTKVPIAVYHVSGEYSMLKFAVQNNIIDEKAAVYETLISMKRAGANLIATYYAPWVCEHLLR